MSTRTSITSSLIFHAISSPNQLCFSEKALDECIEMTIKLRRLIIDQIASDHKLYLKKNFIQADKNIYGENDFALKINNKASGADCGAAREEKFA